MINAAQVRQHLNRVLDGVLPLDDFEEWISMNSLDMHRDGSESEVRTMVGAIELALSEYSSDYLSLAQLMERLRNTLSHVEVIVGGARHASFRLKASSVSVFVGECATA